MQNTYPDEQVRLANSLYYQSLIALAYTIFGIIAMLLIHYGRRSGKWRWAIALYYMLYELATIPIMYFIYTRSWHNPVLAPIVAGITVLTVSYLFSKLKRFKRLYGMGEIAASLLGAWATTRVKRGTGYDALFIIALLGSIYTGVRGFTNIHEAKIEAAKKIEAA